MMASVACEYCGKIRSAPTWGGRERRYCSRSCAKRGHIREVTLNELTPAFGHWLAGLVDGEGCFTLGVKNGVGPRFSLGLRKDDRPVLEMIQRTLGFGVLSNRERGPADRAKMPNANPQTVFECRNTGQCAALVKVFRRFPLQAKKSRDFAIWAEAVDLMLEGGASAGMNRDAFIALANRLVAVRKYVDPDEPNGTPAD